MSNLQDRGYFAPEKSILNDFYHQLPSHPYCRNTTEIMFIRSKRGAVERYQQIQYNPVNSRTWLVFDIDRGISPDDITDDLLMPAPTIFLGNPENGHAHLYYRLSVPVHLNPTSSQAAQSYCAAVENAMTMRLKADAGFAHLVAKNPFCRHWRRVVSGVSYELGELCEYVDLRLGRCKREQTGFGRNCQLFDDLRGWAYRAIRREWLPSEQWYQVVKQQAEKLNQFPSPLHYSEVRGLAKSVAKFTSKYFSPAGFSRRQSMAGKRSAIVRRQNNCESRLAARQMRLKGMSYQKIADELEVKSRTTIMNWCK